ncbi:hypothetical protein DL96DRAFT_1620780 [Flagelloscypha sp. PMI_526]|nr:hypothetical protein DL96DRAFT_1620780 [Flagelloscypha sp. PMI_526]
MASSSSQGASSAEPFKQDKEKVSPDEDDASDSDSDSSTSLIYTSVSLRKVFSTLNATYSLPSGQVIYKTETPREWFAPDHTLIQRVKSGSGPIDEFETIASIHYKAFGASTIQFGEEKILSSALMTKESAFTKSNWSFYGRDRLLTLPDGTRARWSLGVRACALVSADENKTPLAAFHRRRRRSKKPPTRRFEFEIFPAALSVGDSTEYQDGVLTASQRQTVEFILITWLYVEKIRRRREKAARRGG